MCRLLPKGFFFCCFISLFSIPLSLFGTNHKPNIILILTDDQGWADVSGALDPSQPEGYCEIFHTPNILRLAKEGMNFTDAYSPAPICTPTRRSIQFGMTPARQHGTEFLGEFDPHGKWSIAQALKRADPEYRCTHFGKWGEVITGTWGNRESQLPGSPDSLGYDMNDGMNGNREGTFYFRGDPNTYKNTICEANPDPKRTLSVTDKAICFLNAQTKDDRPFYLQISYFAIHTAFQALEETMERYQKLPDPGRKVAGGIAPMLEDLDAAVGQIMETVEKLGLSGNTYIFFTSDNGGEFHSKWKDNPPEKGRNHPLRMYKQTLYEGGIRVPFIVKGPGIRAGSICREPVAGYDLLPTFYELAGGQVPVPQKLDGGSLLSLLLKCEKGTIQRPYPGLYFHRPHPKSNFPGQSAYREGDYKFHIRWTPDMQIERAALYNLRDDISEETDLSEEMPETARRMKQLLLTYLEEIGGI